MTKNNTQLSLIILSWNSRHHIERCLPSLLSALDKPEVKAEIFIVDNGSTDGSVELLKNYEKDHEGIIKPIYLDSNRGTTYSRNLALKEAAGKYIVIMDSDVELRANIMERLIHVLESEKNAGLVVPRLVYGNGSLQKSTDTFPTLWRKIFRYFFLKKIENREDKKPEEENIRKVDYAISAFWLFRKEVLRDVGFLDEKIFYAPEDVDYCLRLWKKGYEILYVPHLYAVHHAQEISRGFKFNKAMREHIKGLIYYFVKHRYFFQRPKFY
ncbi:MAG: glycosyltransferase family 2 protein [Deltaproteobacteria bacterium]|nr:glycosyltransferase family 2 protein [Deltaproteobacteria bacterium]